MSNTALKEKRSCLKNEALVEGCLAITRGGDTVYVTKKESGLKGRGGRWVICRNGDEYAVLGSHHSGQSMSMTLTNDLLFLLREDHFPEFYDADFEKSNPSSIPLICFEDVEATQARVVNRQGVFSEMGDMAIAMWRDYYKRALTFLRQFEEDPTKLVAAVTPSKETNVNKARYEKMAKVYRDRHLAKKAESIANHQPPVEPKPLNGHVVTSPFTVERRSYDIRTVYNHQFGSHGAYVSVSAAETDGPPGINLVVGTPHAVGSRQTFLAKDLRALVAELTTIADILDGRRS